jgi:hypothetical protein
VPLSACVNQSSIVRPSLLAKSRMAARCASRPSPERSWLAVLTRTYATAALPIHPHEPRIYPGIVAVSSEGIALTDTINRYKTTLARILREMDGRTELGVNVADMN